MVVSEVEAEEAGEEVCFKFLSFFYPCDFTRTSTCQVEEIAEDVVGVVVVVLVDEGEHEVFSFLP